MFFSSHSHDPQTMKDFYRPSLIGRGGPITPTTVPRTDFVLKNHMVRLLRQNCQFHGFRDEDANEHLNETLQLRKEILNFWKLPTELVFEDWERFKSCLRKCPDHRILLLNQILTFYNGITMIDQERFMVAVGDAEVYYDTTTGVSARYSKTTSALSAQIEILRKQTAYTIQSKLIHSLSGNPTPSSDSVVESLSPLPTPFEDSDFLMEETDILLSYFDDFVPDYVTFFFNIEEKSSGSTTTHSVYSLPDYEAFYFDGDHIEEKSSGSTTTHFDFSLPGYDLFIFVLSIDPFPPADRSDSYHEKFADELAHIISPPMYDRFYFDLEIIPGEFTRVLEKNIFDLSTKGLTINELNDSSLLLSDCDSSLSKEFSEIDFLVLFPSRNKDMIFDPGIFIIKRVQSKRFHILLLDDFSNISFVGNSLLLIDPSVIETFLSFPYGNENKVFDPGILIIDGIFSFTRKFPHILIDNFLIDKCHILSEISLMTKSSVSFHPKDKEIQRESS
ncbi:hypothetical protein Tco_0145744 [Tanacetum coccineum]